jgi:hypothetical protein
MKFAEGPECDPEASQKTRNDGEPCKHKPPIAGIVARISVMSWTRDTEAAKAEEAASTRGTAVDVAAHHKS